MSSSVTPRLPGVHRYRYVGTALLVLLVLLAACNQGGVSEEEAHQRELVAAGRASFRAYCAGCHGLDATGNGPAAQWMTIPPADLTKITRRHGGTYPEDLVYRRIDGAGLPADTAALQRMLHFGEIWRGENPTPQRREEVDQLINELVAYLETIQTSS